MFEIERYVKTREKEWNEFVEKSKNGTFLFNRQYMDYHEERFTDHSLMFRRDGKLYALLPANVKDGTLYSHQGLTYGGLVTGTETRTVHVMEMIRTMNGMLKSEGIERVVYKAVPSIYHRVPAEEDLYAIHRECSYRITERDVSSAIRQDMPLKWKKDRRHGLKKASDDGIKVEKSDDFEGFWEILSDNLMLNHDAKPVHSADEIRLLNSRFPQNIMLYTSTRGNEMLGGCVVFVTAQVVHTQYIAATKNGKKNGAVDIIIDYLLNKEFPDCTYFDFGKSTEKHCEMLNENLIYQKEGFGGRAVCYDTYEWTL
ncbi:GNAT family N-acetyltransferase [Prevotella sp. OH937_COT-195]|uniref:GNAT family N-acetyltransferase n=1 Tax=Prevotella sp. OH937_COT-195 TaxID=2491051 RepID=UPI000F654E44|nr:GNAT family N-acetyltransferase [Prevotella sp. OH937_COT-195]RRD02376.1 GNAT family N-acetyltransferase [Prevotella sp. OH937_COT-195]